jgi:pSer/pThr/pTyr-binding forkhead associated (FHA) protein
MQVQERVPQLIVQGGPEKGREIPLTQALLTVGRLESSDMPVSDRLVSRRHAEIEREHGQYVLRDCGSRNGTFVNGQRISEPHILRDGDEIQIGLEFKALYIDPEATGALGTEVIAVSRGLWIDQDSREVLVEGKKLAPSVSKAQFSLLTLLYDKPGRVYSRDEIAAVVWSQNDIKGVSDEMIDALVGRLRRRIAAVDPDHRYIVTVRGHGFKLVQPWDK